MLRHLAWAWALETETQTDKLLLLALADHANDEDQCYPSLNTLCELAQSKKRNTQRRLKRMLQLGIIKIRRRKKRDGSLTSNLYILCVNKSNGWCTTDRHGGGAQTATVVAHRPPLDAKKQVLKPLPETNSIDDKNSQAPVKAPVKATYTAVAKPRDSKTTEQNDPKTAGRYSPSEKEAWDQFAEALRNCTDRSVERDQTVRAMIGHLMGHYRAPGEGLVRKTVAAFIEAKGKVHVRSLVGYVLKSEQLASERAIESAGTSIALALDGVFVQS